MSIISKVESTIYSLTPAQNLALNQQFTCFHKQSMQIPLYIIVDKHIDFDLMKKAVNIEIERNDCLRLRFVRRNMKVKQYFIPKYSVDDIPFCDFSEKSESEMMEYLSLDARNPLKFMKGELFRVKFFRGTDGRSGIYFNVCHLNMDISAIIIFFKDLIDTYIALQAGAPMPEPLFPYEEYLKSQLYGPVNQKKLDKGETFLKELFQTGGPSFYAGIDGMRQLNKLRAAKRDLTIRKVPAYAPFHDKSKNLKFHMDEETTERITEFCSKAGAPVQSLIYLGMRTHLSKINEFTPDVTFYININRRATIAEKRMGGCLLHLLPLRTIISEDVTFKEALLQVTDLFFKLIRHSDLPPNQVFDVLMKAQNHGYVDSTASMLLSCFPANSLILPEGWKCELRGCSSGVFSYFAYGLVVPNFLAGGMDFYYEYRTHNFTENDIIELHKNAMEIIKIGIDNPNITIGELLRGNLIFAD
ncbi:MAG: condensation domain-containing protein [Christensenellales bacterium]|jgi:hypothetical protein